MVVEAGSPGIQKQVVKPENLKSMEARYEQTLQELANVIKVPSQTHLNVKIECPQFKRLLSISAHYITKTLRMIE